MDFVLLIVIGLSFVHIFVPLAYYNYTRKVAKRASWNLDVDSSYEPTVTVIVATYNEAGVIVERIKNIAQLDYPKDKLELLIIDSASSDGTVRSAERYIEKQGFPFKISILEEESRRGKSSALNYALKSATSEVIATSDADCLWPVNSLKKAVIYLSDPSVAAVCGHEESTNPNETSATEIETGHRTLFNAIRIGESKIDSTVIFEGALALYKKGVLQEFNEDCDDSGSALDLVQKGYRTLLLPDVFFLNPFPSAWRVRSKKKIRRAQHLVEVFWRCLKLDVERKRKLNALTSRANVFLHLFNPFLFVIFLLTLVLIFFEYPVAAVAIPLVLIIPRARNFTLLYITDHLFLLSAIFRELSGKKQIVWE